MSVDSLVDFTSVRNRNEHAVFDAVARQSEQYPGIAHNAFHFVQARTAMRARG